MCLLIAKKTENGILFGFNRDDNKLRTHNEYTENKDYIFPVDKLSKGTWLGLNKNGNLFALLNNNGQNPQNTKTRGLIIPNLLDNENYEIKFENHAPFQLFQYDNNSNSFQLTTWDGKEKQIINPQLNKDKTIVLTSSSYGVENQRKLIAQRLLKQIPNLNKQNLESLLSEDFSQSSTVSPNMRGKNSQTIATSIIEIDNSKNIKDFYSKSNNPKYSNIKLKKSF